MTNVDIKSTNEPQKPVVVPAPANPGATDPGQPEACLTVPHWVVRVEC